MDSLLDRIVDSTNASVIAAYEKKMAKLEQNKLIMAEKLEEKPAHSNTTAEVFELTLVLLASS